MCFQANIVALILSRLGVPTLGSMAFAIARAYKSEFLVDSCSMFSHPDTVDIKYYPVFTLSFQVCPDIPFLLGL